VLSIIGLLTGLAGPIANIASNITDLQRAKISAATDEKKAEIQGQIEALHDKRAVLVAEAGNRINALIRGIFSIGILVYPLKIFLWDKVIGSFFHQTASIFETDGLSNNDTWVLMTVIGFYFLGNTWPLKRS